MTMKPDMTPSRAGKDFVYASAHIGPINIDKPMAEITTDETFSIL